MITPTQAYTASDGSVHATLEEAQAAELRELLADIFTEAAPHVACNAVVRRLLDNRDRVIDALTTTKRSRAKRRLINGYKGKKQGARASDATVAA